MRANLSTLIAALIAVAEATVIDIRIEVDDATGVAAAPQVHMSQPHQQHSSQRLLSQTPLGLATQSEDEEPGLVCGYWKTGANITQTYENIKSLSSRTEDCCAASEMNVRLECTEGSAITLLNRGDDAVCVPCSDVAAKAKYLVEQCLPENEEVRDDTTVKGSIEVVADLDAWVNVYKRSDC